jgi:hypothetical protein
VAGYVLGDEVVAGFADRPDLDDAQRTTIARWARRFGDVSDEQLRLLDAAPRRRASGRQEELAGNREDMARLAATGVWDALSKEQQGWVVRPGSHPELSAETEYPLTVGQLRQMTGASERQLRHWIDQDIIPAVTKGGTRRVHSAGVAQALLLCQVEQPEKTVLARIASGDARALFPLMAAVLLHQRTASAEVAAAVTALSRLGLDVSDVDEKAASRTVFISRCGNEAAQSAIGRIVLEAGGEVTDRGPVELPLLGLLSDRELLQRAASTEQEGVIVIVNEPKHATSLLSVDPFGGLERPSVVWNVLKDDRGWNVIGLGAEHPSATVTTQAEAQSRAEEIAGRAGGGSVHVHRADGTLRFSKKVTARGKRTVRRRTAR